MRWRSFSSSLIPLYLFFWIFFGRTSSGPWAPWWAPSTPGTSCSRGAARIQCSASCLDPRSPRWSSQPRRAPPGTRWGAHLLTVPWLGSTSALTLSMERMTRLSGRQASSNSPLPFLKYNLESANLLPSSFSYFLNYKTKPLIYEQWTQHLNTCNCLLTFDPVQLEHGLETEQLVVELLGSGLGHGELGLQYRPHPPLLCQLSNELLISLEHHLCGIHQAAGGGPSHPFLAVEIAINLEY